MTSILATPSETAWAAGFFEGEGAIMVLRHGPSRSLAYLSCEVAQIDREPLVFLQARWGGGIYDRESRTLNQRANSRWQCRAVGGAAFLADIEPFIVRPIVRERVRLAIEFQAQKTNTWANRTPEYHERQRWYVARFSELNRRGVAALTPLERAVLSARASRG